MDICGTGTDFDYVFVQVIGCGAEIEAGVAFCCWASREPWCVVGLSVLVVWSSYCGLSSCSVAGHELTILFEFRCGTIGCVGWV